MYIYIYVCENNIQNVESKPKFIIVNFTRYYRYTSRVVGIVVISTGTCLDQRIYTVHTRPRIHISVDNKDTMIETNVCGNFKSTEYI